MFAIKYLSIVEIFSFLNNFNLPSSATVFPQFCRGLNLFLTGASKWNDPATQLIWSIAAIEALLTRKGETGTLSLLEARLRAMYRNDDCSKVVGNLRDIYKMRSALLHGARDIPIWFGGSDTFPFGRFGADRTHFSARDMGLWPFDEAAIASAIAVKLLQVYIELGRDEVSFDTSLRAKEA